MESKRDPGAGGLAMWAATLAWFVFLVILILAMLGKLPT